jgi:predicted RNA-binding protein with RPS1 domain
MPGKDGLLHISEIDWKRYETMEETGIKEGDQLTVKLLEIDKKTGKFRLSAKALKPKPENYVDPESRPRREDRPERPRRDTNRGNGNGNNAFREAFGGQRRDNNAPRRPNNGPRRNNDNNGYQE